MSAISQSDRAVSVRELAERHLRERGPLLPILHEIMAVFGSVERSDLPVIADVLNLSVAEVHGVVSFYHDFRTTPPAAHRVAVCRGEACQSVGAEQVYAGARDSVADGGWGEDVEVGQVFCLGNCALGPTVTVDGRLHGRVDTDRLAALVRERRA